MTTQRNPDEIRTRILTENTAQGVLNHLKTLESNRAHMRTRWIWELLQNARDTSVNTDTDLVISIEHKPGELVFQHNGARFKIDEIAHLIYHGSTKVEEVGTIGQYGSGFLTTHLLSPEINISGQLDDGQFFAFRLKREIGSVQELSESMDRAWDEFNTLSTAPTLEGFTTRFRYTIEDDAVDAVNDGLAMLKRCAPFVVVFNEKFSRIDIKTPSEATSFQVTKRSRLSQVGLDKIRVLENENGNEYNKIYLMAKSKKKTAVAIPLESMDDGQLCLPVDHIPKLFYGIPIVGTENFSFPAVINSVKFTATEKRDGIFLGRNETDKANIENQIIIEEACKLLICLLGFVASSGWRNIYLLTEVPAIQKRDWLNTDWLRECLKEHLIKKIRQTPAIVTEADQAIAPKDAMLPLAKTDAGVQALWDLLNGWQENSEMLPRQDEAVGWHNAVESWANICDGQAISFDEVVNGEKLASCAQRSRHVSRLALKDGICKINWLDQLIGFLRDNGLSEVIHKYGVVPSQEGSLHNPRGLYRDKGIAEELKDIAELLGWPVRNQLCDTGIFSLDDQTGMGDCSSESIVGALVKLLQKRAEQSPDHNFEKASVRLFAWIVGQKDWDRLRGFPVFAKDSNSVLDLPTAHGGEPPLAPVPAWPEGLEQFADLFPPDRILADDFFEAVRDPEAWEQLDKQKQQKPRLIRRSMITTRKETVNFKDFFPEEELPEGNHKTVDCISVTDVVERVKIMDRVSNNQDRAHRFWQFLTDWLIKEDVQSLETKKTKCECGEIHEYYPAAWVMPVRNNRWIRLPKDKWASADAQSLASLFRDNGWNPSSIDGNSAAVDLLNAIGVPLSDLKLEFITGNSEERNELVNTMTELHQATDGDLSQIRAVGRYMQDNEDFSQNLEKLLEATEGDLSQVLEYAEEHQNRQHRGYENQRLGSKVEKLVKAILEKEGFSVERTGIGSDFEISEDTNDIATLDIVQDNQSWLIEVKSTQTENDHQSVRMSSKQAQTAVEKRGEFLLCIVPIGSENTEPDLETVRGNMRFIKNIHEKLGSRVATLCESIEEQEEVLSNTPDDTSSGVDLDFEAGKAGIRVANFVWEDEGFQLENLAEQLKQVKTI